MCSSLPLFFFSKSHVIIMNGIHNMHGSAISNGKYGRNRYLHVIKLSYKMCYLLFKVKINGNTATGNCSGKLIKQIINNGQADGSFLLLVISTYM